MRYLYSLLLYLLTPFIVLRLYWKSMKLRAYRQHILERFSLKSCRPEKVDVWVHAVSLGEAVAVSPLIALCLQKKWRVLVTTMTPTGREQVVMRFGERVLSQYVPYDLPWCLRRFYRQFSPRLGVIMETELWPNMIDMAHRNHIPLLLVNARISDKAFKQYLKLLWVFKPVLNQFRVILAQSELDAKRFVTMGAASDRVKNVGNIKCDIPLDPSFTSRYIAYKTQWGKERPVLIAASTHHDEEHQWLSRLNQLKASIPGLLFMMAPRHPERFIEVFQMSDAAGFKTARQSQPSLMDAQTEVFVIDSLGELLHFYALSDMAFVGGSLVPIGGHNVLEPIALGVPVCCGPYLQNSKALCENLCEKGALLMKEDVDLLVSSVIELFQNRQQRAEQIANATAVLELNRGALARCMDEIITHLGSDAL